MLNVNHWTMEELQDAYATPEYHTAKEIKAIEDEIVNRITDQHMQVLEKEYLNRIRDPE